jgi:hypothetical protein
VGAFCLTSTGHKIFQGKRRFVDQTLLFQLSLSHFLQQLNIAAVFEMVMDTLLLVA